MLASCTPNIKLSTKNLRCFYTATATEKDVTSKLKDIVSQYKCGYILLLNLGLVYGEPWTNVGYRAHPAMTKCLFCPLIDSQPAVGLFTPTFVPPLT